MHPAPENRKVGYGWYESVVPSFNQDLREEYEKLSFIYPGSANFPRRRAPDLRPPLFLSHVPWINKKRMERTMTCWKTAIDPQDPSLSIPTEQFRIRHRASSCPRLERGGHDPTLDSSVSDASKTPSKRGRGRPILANRAAKVRIQNKFADANMVALSGKILLTQGQTDPDLTLETLGRPERFTRSHRRAPLAQAFDRADIAGTIPVEFRSSGSASGSKRGKKKQGLLEDGRAPVTFYSAFQTQTRKFHCVFSVSPKIL